MKKFPTGASRIDNNGVDFRTPSETLPYVGLCRVILPRFSKVFHVEVRVRVRMRIREVRMPVRSTYINTYAVL